MLVIWGLLMCCVAPSLPMDLRETEDSHFRQVGWIGGTTGMAHLLLKVDLEETFEFLDQLCKLPSQLENQSPTFKQNASRLMVSALMTHCLVLKDTVKEQRELWNNPFNWNRKTREISQKIRDKRQAVAMAIMGLIAAGGALFQFHELHEIASKQDKLTHMFKNHETRLNIDERSIEVIKRTIDDLALQDCKW